MWGRVLIREGCGQSIDKGGGVCHVRAYTRTQGTSLLATFKPSHTKAKHIMRKVDLGGGVGYIYIYMQRAGPSYVIFTACWAAIFAIMFATRWCVWKRRC